MADEKDEKSDEKEREKSEEKGAEKWRRDPLGAIIWALILIWAGVVLLLNNLHYLDRFRATFVPRGLEWLPGEVGIWGLIFLGAGVILLFEVVVRLLVPAYRRSVVGTIIVAFVFIGISLGGLISWNLIWAVVLIAIGLSIVVRAFAGRGGG